MVHSVVIDNFTLLPMSVSLFYIYTICIIQILEHFKMQLFIIVNSLFFYLDSLLDLIGVSEVNFLIPGLFLFLWKYLMRLSKLQYVILIHAIIIHCVNKKT